MDKMTKIYSGGWITLDAEHFGGILQETIDREINAFDPFKACVKRLNEFETDTFVLRKDEIKARLSELSSDDFIEKLIEKYPEYKDNAYAFAVGWMQAEIKNILKDLCN